MAYLCNSQYAARGTGASPVKRRENTEQTAGPHASSEHALEMGRSRKHAGSVRTGRLFRILSSLRSRLVAEEDLPTAEGLCFRQLQVQLLFDAVEHRPSLAQNDGIQDDLIFIDQT
jgi:hypothetical protein